MQVQINKVLMFSDARFQLWLQRDCFFAVFADGTTDKWCVPEQEDLFVLPMNGLSKLAIEYYGTIRARVEKIRTHNFGPDIGADGELYGVHP